MITKDIFGERKFRFSRLALFILRYRVLTRVIMHLFGLVRAIGRIRTGSDFGKISLPIFRLKILLWVFINRDFRLNTGDLNFSKTNLLRSLDNLRQNKAPHIRPGLIDLVNRFKDGGGLLFEGDYILEFLRDYLANDIKREGFKRNIMSLTFDITNSCNRHCLHCFAKSTKKRGEEIDYSFLQNALNEARSSLGCKFFNILGGEPFLEFGKIKRIAHDFRTIPIQVFTNGDFINESVANELHSVPNVIPMLSLEGDQAMTNLIRGKKAYESVSRSFEILKRNKLLYGASVTATRNNYEYISSEEFSDEIIRFGVYYVWIFDLKPIGRTNNDSLCLSLEERSVFNDRIARLNRMNPFIFLNTEKDPEVIGGCPATKGSYLHIFTDGGVMPCITIRYNDEALNIAKMSLTSILESRVFQEYRSIGCSKGCAQRLEPQKYRSWIKRNSLVERF